MIPLSRQESIASHRILDANLNRAFEGLRTLEDIARFQNFADLQSQLKSMRHSLEKATSDWNRELLFSSRNAELDVGKNAKTPSENSRSSLNEVGIAAAQRVQQALRCLEEVAKLVYPGSAADLESARYQAYDLNAKLLLSLSRDRHFLGLSRLYVLAHCQMPIADFSTRISEISKAGASLIQIRDKHIGTKDTLRFVEAAINSVDPNQTQIVVNDRPDIAFCTGVWGLHVGQSDFSIAQARSIVGPTTVVGLSTHDTSQVEKAIIEGADYIGCGPTFPSKTKPFESFSGLHFLQQTVDLLKLQSSPILPAFAIGGIQLSNLRQVLATGIRRVVVGNAIWEATSPGIATEAFCDELLSNPEPTESHSDKQESLIETQSQKRDCWPGDRNP